MKRRAERALVNLIRWAEESRVIDLITPARLALTTWDDWLVRVKNSKHRVRSAHHSEDMNAKIVYHVRRGNGVPSAPLL